MKSKVRFKGKLRSYLCWPLWLTIPMTLADVGLYFYDVTAGFLLTVFIVVYFVLELGLYYNTRPRLANEIINFATQYATVQKKLLNEFEIPYALLDYTGKILVMNYDALKPEYRSRPYQLWLATGGFGCSPTARGRRVFATSLYDGEQSSFYRQDFTGIIKPEVWEEVQSQYDFQITTQEVHKNSETPQEGMEP